LSETVSAIESRVTQAASDARDKVDVSRLIQEHPWTAMAAAIVAGAALSATRADEKAADVTVKGAKQAASAAADGIARVVEPHARTLGDELARAADELRPDRPA
jgi:hypothetical protein